MQLKAFKIIVPEGRVVRQCEALKKCWRALEEIGEAAAEVADQPAFKLDASWVRDIARRELPKEGKA